MQLRPYQIEGLTSLWSYFDKGGKGNPLLCWPTGTGKSIVPAIFIQEVMRQWPDQRFLMITSVSELIKQNLKVLKLVWPNAPVGIYSAGLNQKDIAFPIIYGGIQSMVKNPSIFGHRDIAFVDEAHLISQNDASMYLTFFATLKLINPKLKIIGMTATPYRMGQGRLIDDGLFTDIAHDITGMESFNKLIGEGFLAPLIPQLTKTELDVSNVGMAKGDFIAKQLQGAVDKQEITFAGLRETVEAGYDRGHWLIFSSGIEHSEHIAAMLGTFGIECAAVHSKQPDDYNDAAIKAFKEGSLRSIASFSKLTTGFDDPLIELIADFRPTMSIPLHVQKYGRGTRPAEGKNNCKVLDFARNTRRLGPINDPIIPRKKGEKAGDAPIKLCPVCGAYNHISARICIQCKEEFAFQIKIFAKADTEQLIRSDLPITETFDVDRVFYAKHEKSGKPPSIKVMYFCGMQMFNEYVCFEHGGMAAHKARDWWRQRHATEPPTTTDEALMMQAQLRAPKRINVWVNTKYPTILSAEY